MTIAGFLVLLAVNCTSGNRSACFVLDQCRPTPENQRAARGRASSCFVDVAKLKPLPRRMR